LSDQIEATNQVPNDLREKLLAIRTEFGPMWPLIEIAAEEFFKDPRFASLAEE